MTTKPYLKFALLLCAAIEARSQEPALFPTNYFYGQTPAVRYEQAAGVFHYVLPCRQFVAGNTLEPAVCWPVNAVRLRILDGKVDQSAPIQGILTVSATQVRFIPQTQKNMEFNWSVAIADASFSRQPGKPSALVSSKQLGFQFAFVNICLTACTPGAALLDPNKGEQADAEYKNVSDSLKQFDAVYARLHDTALMLRFTVEPRNQPKPEDVHAAMGLYATLNQHLAEVCPEPAKSCLRSYQSYQACESSASPANCGAPPACTAVCSLTPDVYHGLNAGACESPTKDSATVYPNWTDALKQEDAERAAHGDAAAPQPCTGPGVAGMAGMGGTGRMAETNETVSPAQFPGWASLREMPGRVPAISDYPTRTSDGSCSAQHVYDMVKAMHQMQQPLLTMAQPPPPTPPNNPPSKLPNDIKMIKDTAPPPNCSAGMAGMGSGMGGLLGGVPGGMLPGSAVGTTGPNGTVRVSSGTMAVGLLEKPDPVYPPLAKAAHVQGIVILHAIISKTGTVENLKAISGPPLLQQSAIDAVMKWKYKPFFMNGAPVEVETTVTVNFTFGDRSTPVAPPAPPQ